MRHLLILKKWCGVLFLFLFLELCPAADIAADGSGWRAIGQVGGPTQAVAVQGDYAYVGVGLRLVVLDISDPSAPREVGAARPFSYFVQDIAVSGTLAYVAAGAAGLRIVDIANPAAPIEVGAWESRGHAEGVAVAGTTAYLANGPYGLRVLDVSKPSQPVEVGSVYPMNYAFKVAANGRYACIAAAGAGLLIADVSDPKRPLEAGSLATRGYAYGVAVTASTAYVADGWDGLKIVDVSDPARAYLAGAYKTPGWALAVTVSGSRAYVSDAFRGLRVLDVFDPARPVEVAESEVATGHAGSVAVSGGTAFIADRNWGLRVVSLAEQPYLRQVGFYGPMGFAHGVTVDGDYAYVAAGAFGLRVINISDPAQPVETGVYDTESYALSVAVVGGYAYVATTDAPNIARGFHVVDIRDPSHPVRAGFLRHPFGTYRDMTVAGGIAYIPDEHGFQLIDLSDPSAPRELAYLPLSDFLGAWAAVGVGVEGNFAYLAAERDGLKVVDVSDPSQPVVVGECRWPNATSQDVVLTGGYAYVLDAYGLAVVNVSNPRQPVRVAYRQLPPFAESLTLAGNLLFIASGGTGVTTLDISTPTNPTPVAACNTLGNAQHVLTRGDLAYVADQDGGLLILGKPSAGANPQSRPALAARTRLGPVPAIVSPPPRVITSPGTRTRAALPRTGGACLVKTTADSGLDSLRWCLENAVEGDTITFDTTVFQPDRPATIALASALPMLRRGGMTIEASGAGVILDGARTPPNTSGLSLVSAGNTVRGLRISGFPGNGIGVGAAGNLIGGSRDRGEGNLISGNGQWGIMIGGQGASDNVVTGNDLLGNAGQGIALANGAQRNRIGGTTPGERNLISGNGSNGVNIDGAATMSNIVIGNYIGTDAVGAAAMPNRGSGVFITGRYNRIGGTGAGERNVISGNRNCGVAFTNSGADNLVAGNYIGTTAGGNQLVAGGDCGVAIEKGAQNNVIANNVIVSAGRTCLVINDWGSSFNTVAGNLVGLDATGSNALGCDSGAILVGMGSGYNRIGGIAPAERNVISGGVTLFRQGAIGNLVVGNFIGTDLTGSRPLSRRRAGVTVTGGSRRPFIGGTTPGERNVISGNQRGIVLDPGADYAFIGGNYIGTDSTGTEAVGNQGPGIAFYSNEHNMIQGNRIAYNQGDGVGVSDSHYITLRRNSIYSHGGAGIGLSPGANKGIAAPLLIAVVPAGVSGTACPNCEVEIFSDSGGQGRIFEGSASADAAGVFRFDKGKPLAGPNVAATATDRQGNTSGFSAPRAVPR